MNNLLSTPNGRALLRHALQATHNAPDGKPSNDTAATDGRNTEPLEAVGGAGRKPETKKVLRQLLARYQVERSHQKTNNQIRHMRGTK